ncbi:MAG: hypothetical protein IT377_11500 [Polyangiaceae bacterium]|nr:hypothetical protein [Polyangiaceae bacterium]
MSDRTRRGSAPPEVLGDDDLPTEEHLGLDALTDDDIEDSIQTVERRLPAGLFGSKLPRFETTGTITLPRDFSEPATLPRPLPVPVAAPTRTEPPPKPSLRAWATPPPKPVRSRDVTLEDSGDHAPTPVRRLSDPGPPPPRAPSIPPPLPPPPARAARAPSLPPPVPPAPARPPSLPPPAPPPRTSSLPPPPRMPSAPDLSAASAETPTPKARPMKRGRPKAPEPPAADVTREFALQVPVRRRVEPSPSHTPPPLTASTPPPPAGTPAPTPVVPRAARLPSRPRSLPPAARADRLPTPLEIAGRHLGLSSPRAISAAIGVFAALVLGVLVIMVATTFRQDDREAPPAGPVVAARPVGTPRPAEPIAVPTQVTAAPTVAPAPPPPPSAPLGSCRLVTVPRRIAGPVMPNVPVMATTAPGLNRVAIGYASGRNHAEGAIVNLDDLSVEPRYSEELTGPVFRVTPLTDRAPVAFAVDRDDPRIQSLRTIPASPPLRVGASFFGFVRVNEPAAPTVIWPGARFEGISEPSFAVTDRDGYGVAFRSGRGSGDVLAGWLTKSGTADGDLGRVDAGAREVGPPSMAANDKHVVVVFAARGTGETWHLRIASAARGKAPTLSRELGPRGGTATEAIAPVIVALPSGFLLHWLDGPPGARRVLARTLDDSLAPQGVPIELAQGANILDAPGALAFRSGRVLAVHLASMDKSVELRAAVLACG